MVVRLVFLASGESTGREPSASASSEPPGRVEGALTPLSTPPASQDQPHPRLELERLVLADRGALVRADGAGLHRQREGDALRQLERQLDALADHVPLVDDLAEDDGGVARPHRSGRLLRPGVEVEPGLHVLHHDAEVDAAVRGDLDVRLGGVVALVRVVRRLDVKVTGAEYASLTASGFLTTKTSTSAVSPGPGMSSLATLQVTSSGRSSPSRVQSPVNGVIKALSKSTFDTSALTTSSVGVPVPLLLILTQPNLPSALAVVFMPTTAWSARSVSVPVAWAGVPIAVNTPDASSAAAPRRASERLRKIMEEVPPLGCRKGTGRDVSGPRSSPPPRLSPRRAAPLRNA